MPRNIGEVLRVAEAALLEQNVEIAAAVRRQMQAVTAQASTGSGNMDAAFSLDVRFRLVFVRCHYSGSGMTSPMAISLDSAAGPDYDATLFTIRRAGLNRDVSLRIPAEESAEPSPWTFQPGDAVRIQWTNPNPGSITWGLQVGLAIAA